MDARRLSPPLVVAALAATGLVAAAAAPGWLAPEAGGVVRSAFSAVCHQIPERSPHLGGGTWALCHRCTGIAAGLAGAVVLSPLLPRSLASRLAALRLPRVIALALVPMAADWLLGAAGIWANTPLSRTATGALFGVAAGLVLALGLRPQAGAPYSSPNLLSA